jgi:DNA topoisomerase-1
VGARVVTDQSQSLPADLLHVSDTEPGIARRRRGKGFSYHTPDGKSVSTDDLARIKSLAIPPAYRSVWICSRANGHLQATGLDDRGRKQYRYHPDWALWRSEVKYRQLPTFGAALGRLRRRINMDLQVEASEREFVLAALVFLIDRTALRVGDEAYQRENGSFGATTLLSRHIRLTDGRVRLSFRGKGGKRVVKTLADKRLHRVLDQIGDLPGRHLFSHSDGDGCARRIHSHEVNSYISDTTGINGATAKTFRTWAGTLAAFEVAMAENGTLTRKMLEQAAADRLANTPAICRKSYIHPQVLDLAELESGERQEIFKTLSTTGDQALRANERRLLCFLERSA